MLVWRLLSGVRGRVPRIAVLGWSLTVANHVGAQSPRVGVLDGVRGVASPSDCKRDYALKAEKGVIRLFRQNAELVVTPRDSAFVADRLRVRRHNDLRFHVDGKVFGRGNFFLSPEVGRCPRVGASLKLAGIETGSGDGSYQLSSRAEWSGRNQVARLLLSVENGAATIEWAKGTGALSVFALGREIQVTGTVLTVLVDSALGRGLLYVREGSVTVLGRGEVHATQGSAFVFDRSGAPTSVTLTDDVLGDFTYHQHTVWVQRVKPGFPYWRVLGGAALGSGAYLIWHNSRSSKSSGPFDGNINVNLPL